MWGWSGRGGTSSCTQREMERVWRWTGCRGITDEWKNEQNMDVKWTEEGKKNRWMRNKGRWKAWKTKEMHCLMGLMKHRQMNKREEKKTGILIMWEQVWSLAENLSKLLKEIETLSPSSPIIVSHLFIALYTEAASSLSQNKAPKITLPTTHGTCIYRALCAYERMCVCMSVF